MFATPIHSLLPSCLVAVAALLALSACVVIDGPNAGEKALRTPAAPEISFVKARGLLDRGQAIEAVSAFRALVRRDRSDLASLNGLAIAYGELGRLDLAAETFAKALSLSPDDAATLNNIGFAALRRAEPALARRYLERAAGLRSDHGEIEGNLERLATLDRYLARKRSKRPVRRVASIPIHHRSAGDVMLGSLLEKRPSAVMIDFTAVRDPFADGKQ